MKRRVVLFIVPLLAVLLLALTNTALANPIDLDRYCRDNGWGRAVTIEHNAYGWRCQNSSGTLYNMSLDDACRTQYGSEYRAVSSNYNDPYSWSCQGNSIPAPTNTSIFVHPTATTAPSTPVPNPTLLPTSRPDPTLIPVSTSQPSGSPRVVGSVAHAGGCKWHVTLQLENFQPYSDVTADLRDSGAQNCSGTQTNPRWANWQVGRTDQYGRFAFAIEHGDYGWYDFSVRDSHGNQASVRVSYGSNGQVTQPTSVPSNNGGGNGSSCSTTKNLSIGAIAVTTDDARLRQSFSTSQAVLVTIPEHSMITMIGGPSCGDGYVWWESQYGGHTGWVAEINLIRNGDPYPGGNGGNPNPQPTQRPNPTQPPSSSCPGAHSPTIGVGQRGRVTAGPDSGVWDAPQGNVQFYIREFTEFTVISDARCTTARQGYLWWANIRLDDGRSGWTAYGYSNGIRWIEPVPGNGPGNNDNHIQTINVSFPNSGENYALRVNTRTCAIMNGASIIQQELNRFTHWVTQQRSLRDIADYFKVNSGTIEQFRHIVENTVKQSTGCFRTYYLVGTHATDTSGLGNIVFGYFSSTLPQLLEDVIAAAAQGFNDESPLWFWDNPDDTIQRRLGRSLAYLRSTGIMLNEEIISRAAEEIGLF